MPKKIKRPPQAQVEPKQANLIASAYGARLARQVASQSTGSRIRKKASPRVGK